MTVMSHSRLEVGVHKATPRLLHPLQLATLRRTSREETFFEFWTRACGWWWCQCTGMSSFFLLCSVRLNNQVTMVWERAWGWTTAAFACDYNAEWKAEASFLADESSLGLFPSLLSLSPHGNMNIASFRLMWNRVTILGPTSIFFILCFLKRSKVWKKLLKLRSNCQVPAWWSMHKRAFMR